MTEIQIKTLPDCIQTRPQIDEGSREWNIMHNAGLNGVTGITCREDQTILAYSSLRDTHPEEDSLKLTMAFRAAKIVVYLNEEPPKAAEPPVVPSRRWGKLALWRS